MSDPHDNVQELIDHLFRHKAGQLVATLTRIFGAENLQMAEDVVQETLIKALNQWTYQGVPDNPSGWLMQVAKNRALDILRREANLETKLMQLTHEAPTQSTIEDSLNFDDSMGDDQLTMLFMGCHGALSTEMQVALLLKTLGGFSAKDIARAFLVSEATVAQRIVRAKRKIRDEALIFALPTEHEFAERLEAVLLVIYLIFNEGYNAAHGNHLIRQDLCAEAIRLGSILLKHPQGNHPHVQALMALMFLQSSRLNARVSGDNELLLLSEQDRTQWDRVAIQNGIYHLEQAGQGAELSIYHLQAGIAAAHALAKNYDATNWAQILFYYDQLLELTSSAVIQLNRAVVIANIHGAKAGLDELNALPELDNYYLFYATRASFLAEIGDFSEACANYQQALDLCSNEVEQRFLAQRLQAMKNMINQ